MKYKKPVFNGVVKLASLLQKALETGRSNYIEMNEISRYMGYYVKRQIDDSCMYMNYVLNNYKNIEHFKQLSYDLKNIFNDTNKAIVHGYEKLVAPNGSVNKSLLEQLIQIDTEITTTMNIIRSTIMNASNRDGITGEEIKEITGMIKELRTNINKRIKIVKQI
ncbi:MAG: hypothetical protein EX285_05465 [Thaumarchaeota archaeon]|nr:hypothetical protein [Nitrososphaerota archaeon]